MTYVHSLPCTNKTRAWFPIFFVYEAWSSNVQNYLHCEYKNKQVCYDYFVCDQGDRRSERLSDALFRFETAVPP